MAREVPKHLSTPYLEALMAYGFRGPRRFHVPGNKGGLGADPALRNVIGQRAFLLDIPQDIEGIDIGPSPTPFERAELLAAEVYGAGQCWFLTNGATQGNHALALALAPRDARVVIQRNSHASLIDGLVLSGGLPSFVAPAYDPDLGMAHGVEPDALAGALELTQQDGPVSAAFIVSPTYYGMAADVGGCVEVAHAAGVPLVVDCAWGAHFGFHDSLPRSPLQLGADAMLASTHKIVGSMTQSAMLLVADGGLIDAGEVARAVRIMRSTSPNALLLASLDAARRQLAVHGESLLDRTIGAARRTRAAIDEIPGCRVVGAEMVGRPGIAGWDPLRIVVDVRGTGLTGYQVAEALRAGFDIFPELATHATVVLVLGLAQPLEPLERVAHDLGEAVRRVAPTIEPEELPSVEHPLSGTDHSTVVPPRVAFFGRQEAVPVDQAAGRISCESIAGYPPGIPTLLPGELVTADVIDYLRGLTRSGARLHGASDPAFRTIRVLVRPRDAADPPATGAVAG